MLINNHKKMFLYYVDPLFFKDSANDGYGDFQGFLSKLDYLESLNIDGIIFPDLFNQEKVILKPHDISIFNKYGKLIELKQIIEKLKEKQIDFFMEISLKDILNSNMNANLEDRYNDEILIKKYDPDFKQIDWTDKTSTKLLNHIIHFWNKRNINNFVITNFENLNFSNEENTNVELNQTLLDSLNHIYDVIKKNDPEITICLKSSNLSPKTINTIFEHYIGKICDFFIDNAYGFIGTNKNHPNHIQEPFVAKKIFKRLKKIRINPINYYKYIISFDSNHLGRVSSRWFDETILHNKANKTFLLINNFLPYSSINYYGNELGMLRTKITKIEQYYDFDYNEQKRKLESCGYLEEDFHQSQLYLSRIHSQSIFTWDDSLNGGFSESQFLIRKPPMNYQIINVKNQVDDSLSILNFYKSLVNFIKNSKEYQAFFYSPTIIKIKKIWDEDLYFYQLINNKTKLNLMINPTNKCLLKRVNKKQHILFSSYEMRTNIFNKKTRFINPYESFVFINKLKLDQLTKTNQIFSDEDSNDQT